MMKLHVAASLAAYALLRDRGCLRLPQTRDRRQAVLNPQDTAFSIKRLNAHVQRR